MYTWRVKILLGAVLFTAACGSVSGGKPDAAVDFDGPPADSPTGSDGTAARCDPNKPFGTPVAVPELNSPKGEGAMSVSADERTIYFTSDRNGGVGMSDVYLSTRASATATWSTPTLLAGVNTAGLEQRPTLPTDELTVYFETSAASAPGSWQLAAATRTSTSVPFGAWVPVAQLNSTANDTAPFVLPDHSAIYFLSDRGAGHELYRAARTGGNWAPPVLVTGTNLNDTSVDYPAITSDELTLYFSSTRAGGAGNRDFWVATRTSTVSGFGTPVNVAALNTNAYESTHWISGDGCVMYFARDVSTALDLSNVDILRAQKPL